MNNKDLIPGFQRFLTEKANQRPIKSRVVQKVPATIKRILHVCLLGCIVLILISSIPIVPALADTDRHDSSSDQAKKVVAQEEVSPADNQLNVTYTLQRAPNVPGHVLVTATVRIPSNVSSLDIDSPPDSKVQRTHGINSDEEGALGWKWDGTTSESSITYLAPVDVTSGEDLRSVATDQWALFDWRTVGLEWEYDRPDGEGKMEPVETARVSGSGVTGPNFVYLGAYETHQRTVEGTNIHLIVPEAAHPADRPQTILTALARTERALNVKAQSRGVTVFVAPEPIQTTGLTGGVTENGRHDLQIHQSAHLSTPDSAFIHEYIHSKQDYTVSQEMEWFTEASAEYYAALFAYEQGLISFGDFHSYAENDNYTNDVLTEPNSWSSENVPYFKGMRVLAALDAEIRAEGDGSRTLEHVLRRMNQHDSEITHSVFTQYVTEAAGTSFEEWLSTYLKSSEAPDVPADASHYGQTQNTGWADRPDTVTTAVQTSSTFIPITILIVGLVLLLVGWARDLPTDDPPY